MKRRLLLPAIGVASVAGSMTVVSFLISADDKKSKDFFPSSGVSNESGEKRSLLSIRAKPSNGMTITASSDHIHASSAIFHSSFESGYSYPANNPSEDRFVCSSNNNRNLNHSYQYAAVFDGHGGWQVSQYASDHMMRKLLAKVEGISVSDEISFDLRIQEAFDEIEREIVDIAKPAFELGFGGVARVGSCVLVALQKENRLVVINCGDCRAVLGSQSLPDSSTSTSSSSTSPSSHMKTVSYMPTRINRDHNARVGLEQLHLENYHPNEGNLVVCKNPHACYVKGRLQLTRSLGDLYLKYPEFNGTPDGTRGRYIPSPFTPPYVSHRAEVHHIRLNNATDRFVIIGTDGLWDYLSDQEAVDIVGECIQQQISPHDTSKRLVNRALEIAAAESRMTLDDLKLIPQGSKRRARHDDTTCVVLYF